MVTGLRAVIAGFAIVIALMAGLTVVDALYTVGTDRGQGSNTTNGVGIVGGSASFTADTVDSVYRARTSLNDSVNLSGAPDSNVTIDSDADLGHDLSVCTYGVASSDTVTNDRTQILLATQAAVLQYNGTTDEWQGYYYNTSSRNSFRASVTAASPNSPTLVCLNHGQQNLNVSANTTRGTNVTTGTSNIAAYPTGGNWNGTVEETRLYDYPLNTSQRADWVAEPVLAVNGEAPATRVTYDTTGTTADTFGVYFASGSATASNASLVTGRRGPAITEGTDYSISGSTISIGASNTLNQTGEVLYVTFLPLSGTMLQNVVQGFGSFSGLAALVPLLLIATVIIARLRSA